MYTKTPFLVALLALCACGTSPNYTLRDQWNNELGRYLPGTRIDVSVWQEVEGDSAFGDRFRPTTLELELSSSNPAVVEIVDGRAYARVPGEAELSVVVDDTEVIRTVRVQNAAEIRIVDDSWFRNSGLFSEPMGGRILAFERGRVDVHARYFNRDGNRIYGDHVLEIESELHIEAPEGTPQGNVVRAFLDDDDAQLTLRVPGATATIDVEAVDSSDVVLSLQHVEGAGDVYGVDDGDVVFLGGTVDGTPVRGVAPHARWDAEGVAFGVGTALAFRPGPGATRLRASVGSGDVELDLPLDVQEALLIP